MSLSIATLICVYAGDSAELFRGALQSILTQDLPQGVESRVYLGIDGPLPEALEAVVAAHGSSLYRVYRAPGNQGLARTLNALIAMLEDEAYVFRMDADDLSLPGRYRAQLNHLERHPEIDILGTAITEVDTASGTEREVRFASGPEDALANIHRRVPVAHPTVCFRRHVFRSIAGYPLVEANEDIALWFECVRRGFRFDNLRASLLRFRISPGFWNRRSFRKARSELSCYLRGIHSLHGPCTWRYCYPVLRFLLRLSPTFVSRWAYQSAFRIAPGKP